MVPSRTSLPIVTVPRASTQMCFDRLDWMSPLSPRDQELRREAGRPTGDRNTSWRGQTPCSVSSLAWRSTHSNIRQSHPHDSREAPANPKGDAAAGTGEPEDAQRTTLSWGSHTLSDGGIRAANTRRKPISGLYSAHSSRFKSSSGRVSRYR